MKLIYLLHFYQPDFQFKQVLEDVYYNSYKKIFDAIDNAPNAKIVVNITASTIEMLNNYNVGNIIEDLKALYSKGKIEFTATSMAHVLLSHASYEQSLRQVKLDFEKKSYYLGVPQSEFNVLFPTELSVNDQVLKLAKEYKFKALIASHSSIKDFSEDNNKFEKDGLKLFARSLKLSRICESPDVLNVNTFFEMCKNEGINDEQTYVIAHDAEILGYRNHGKTEFFTELLNNKEIKLTTFSEELKKKNNFKALDSKIKPGTWEKMPINNVWIDPHWKNPKNRIHTAQWKLSRLIVKEIEQFPDINKKLDLQTHLDYCQYSCQYWWASSFPFWSSGIISHAAWTWLYLAYKVYYELLNVDQNRAATFLAKAESYYMNIIKNLAQYDISKWHEKNILYFDQFIQPLKLKFKI